MKIKCKVNGKVCQGHVNADTSLMEFLREEGYKSVKCGCDTTNCGLCTVYLDGKPVLSCSVLAARAENHEITTLEGVAEEAEEFARYMAAQGAEQCGYCSPGFIMNVLAMTKELKDPSEDEIKEYLSGNLCRCTGYQSQMRAIKNYLASVKGFYHALKKGEVIESVNAIKESE